MPSLAAAFWPAVAQPSVAHRGRSVRLPDGEPSPRPRGCRGVRKDCIEATLISLLLSKLLFQFRHLLFQFPHLLVILPFHRMLELEHRQVQFEGGFAALDRQHICKQILHQLATTPKQCFLFQRVLLLLRYFRHHSRQFLQLRVCLHDGNGGFHCSRTF